jgi:hypothetical protein
MATFKTITAEDIQTTTSALNQLVDVVQDDISGSSSRKKYQVFVTGGIGPGVTSSLFQTVYDQDFTLQTANPVFDMTVGLFEESDTVQDCSTGTDANGKLLFPSQSLMMREKVENYKQFAQFLLGDSDAAFYSPGVRAFDANVSFTGIQTGSKGDRIEEALFVGFKRLFSRDEIKKETFAIRLYQSAALDGAALDGTANGINLDVTTAAGIDNNYTGSNLFITSVSGSTIYADVGSSTTQLKYFGGDVGYIKNTSNTDEYVGLIWYDQGVMVLDMGRVFAGDQHMSGAIDAMSNVAPSVYGNALNLGQVMLGNSTKGSDNPNAKFIPDFVVSASIDNVVDHIAATRFSSGSLTAATFQNITGINSTLYFCRATADEFNYSSNPTFRDAGGNITVIDPGNSTGQRSFTFVTTVGLYNSNNELLAVAKLSRPVEKNDEKDLSVRVRLDF